MCDCCQGTHSDAHDANAPRGHALEGHATWHMMRDGNSLKREGKGEREREIFNEGRKGAHEWCVAGMRRCSVHGSAVSLNSLAASLAH